ncbi:MAG: hypothetical protein LBE12_07145 [Planctomycetaceae bacterium]|nr:hypothetical protein [Planctomycetaceae bacterium]
MIVDSAACGMIAVWVVIRMRYSPLSTRHYQLDTINYDIALSKKWVFPIFCSLCKLWFIIFYKTITFFIMQKARS